MIFICTHKSNNFASFIIHDGVLVFKGIVGSCDTGELVDVVFEKVMGCKDYNFVGRVTATFSCCMGSKAAAFKESGG